MGIKRRCFRGKTKRGRLQPDIRISLIGFCSVCAGHQQLTDLPSHFRTQVKTAGEYQPALPSYMWMPVCHHGHLNDIIASAMLAP